MFFFFSAQPCQTSDWHLWCVRRSAVRLCALCTFTGFKYCRAAQNTHKTFLFFPDVSFQPKRHACLKNVLHVYAAFRS